MAQPGFYRPERVGQLYVPDVARAVAEGRAAGLPPAEQDASRVLLILVDVQVDFVHTDGALSVPGAVEDTRRIIEWLLRHSERVTTVALSLDSHVPIQIFFPTWWADGEGRHPNPFTPISSDDVQQGRWVPLYKQAWSVEYVERLEEQAKKVLMIWPYHTMIGTPGHTITPALYEAIAYHSAARQTEPIFLIKGSVPETEHYSVLEAEVKVPDRPESHLNTAFLETMAEYDRVYIAGQAKSHCVLETVTSIMRYCELRPEVMPKLRVLIDATSSVAHPEIDFEAMANETLQRFEQQGLTLARTTDPL